uniref:Uncharacterized LOC113122097 n=1 Tax=Mastacembelus armatus TaxID=205130 RepID=A0A7N8X4M0_9TELE
YKKTTRSGQDAESLDNCIQSTLSALYRPFTATAATVLWQLFSVVERQYRGDGLRCLIDFLLPAKRILQIIQQETCVRFRGLLFYHEGWPLCIHEKVILQLAPLHKVRLKQGDFYLQIVPLGRKNAKLVIKCLTASGQAIAEIPIAESMYVSIFTAEFLQNVTRDRNLHPLQNCLLTTGTAVYRTSWKNVINPLFVSSTSDAIMQARCSRGGFRGHLSTCSTSGSTGTLDSHRSSRESLHSQGADSIFSEPTSPSRDHMDPSSESPSVSAVHTAAPTIKVDRSTDEHGIGQGDEDSGSRERVPGSKMLSFSTDLSNPGPRRRHPKDSGAFESRRLFRKSYMEALQNPMSLGSSSESILEDSPEHSAGLRERTMSPGSSPDTQTSSREHLSRRLGSRGWLSRQRDDISSESRRRRHSVEESQSPKAANGIAVRLTSVSSSYFESASALPRLVSEVDQELLTSGAVILPGNRDRSGRAVLQVCTRAQVWAGESCTVSDLTCLLGYYYSILRKERRDQGLTVVIDSRRQQPVPALLSSLSELQVSPQCLCLYVCFLPQTETLSSLKALLKHIDQSQLTRDLDGTFHYDHNHWIHFRQKIEPFASSCSAAITSLQESISTLSNSGDLKTSKEVSEVLEQQRHLMKSVLEDTRLNKLRLEGGTILARIRKEDACDNENYRDAVDLLNALYNQVDEEVHKLVILSNKTQKELESLLEVRRFEEQTQQVISLCLYRLYYRSALTTELGTNSLNNPLSSQIKLWFSVEGEKHLTPLESLTLSANACVLLPGAITPLTFEDIKSHPAGPVSKSPSSSVSMHFTFPPECDSKLRHSPSIFDDTDSDCTIDSTISCHSEPVYTGAARLRKQPMKKIMKKTMSYELTQREGGHSDVSHIHGYTGVYIKGLEVANNVSAEKKLQRPDVASPALGRSRSMSTPSRIHNRCTNGDGKKQSNKVQHIMDEMISTEREYVRSLSYIIEHYFPEMERLDLPQDLRGKRSIIFGNVEKLWDFHSQYFLKELESCAHSPLSISSCFLRHEDQFGMYALYSKNKPQSDALLSSHGNEFFKNKQLELGDKMDLASYLLKPIQRMSKYALLLKDLIKECSQSQEQELSDLRTAEEMVKFQLRHGNDLLAMDAIRDCDVNLKEQGQLRCQDEFIVWCGRRKYLRHVFLFEDLILFSKTKKIEGGYDIYIYKQSFKTAEIGMTENVGDSGLRFEIWFRRRKSQDTFILQASSAEVKAVWTAIIGKILWRQALRNRELRMQEMVSMGIGSKPFMDIKPSDAAISDRAIDYIMKGSESRTRASIAVPSFEHSTSFKRPHSTISNSSTSSSSSQSSSSLLGSLNLHLYTSPSHPHTHPFPAASVPSFAQWPYDCIEEDELEQDSGSQPSMSE